MARILQGKLVPAEALDARLEPEFQTKQTVAASNVPAVELAARIYELPAIGTMIRVYRTGEEAEEAAEFLVGTGREIEFVEPVWGPSTDDLYRLWSAPEFLVEEVKALSPGRALCLACGSGREAVHLAAGGWRVVAIDRLPDALMRGRLLEARYTPRGNPKIEWLQADLRMQLPSHLGRFDLVCELFAWQSATPGHFASALKSNGTGLWESFADRRETGAGWTELNIVQVTSGWRESRKTRRFLLKLDESSRAGD